MCRTETFPVLYDTVKHPYDYALFPVEIFILGICVMQDIVFQPKTWTISSQTTLVEMLRIKRIGIAIL